MLKFMKLVSSYRQNSYTRSTKIISRLISTSKYADPKIDLIFKRLFGHVQNADLLIDFLNKALPEKKIKTVQYLPTNLDPEAIINKQSIIDILCFDEKGSKYIVEMQNAKEKGFEKRAQYYASKAYSDQMKKDGKYADLVEIIFIAITDFIMFPEKESFISTHKSLDIETKDNDLRDFTYIFIELPKYKSHKDFKGIEDWCELLKYASERSTPHISSDIMDKAYRSLEVSGFSETDILALSAYEKMSLDKIAREDQVREEGIMEGKKEGKKEGNKEGKKEGKKEEKIHIAKILLEEGRPLSYISNVVGLSEDELSKLQ